MMLSGKRVLISAGPMRTSIDPVRYLQNRSSGIMGLQVARAAKAIGAQVSVLLGPVEAAMAASYAVFPLFRYFGPAEYAEHLDSLFPDCDFFLSLAAVLDFETTALNQKMEREWIARNPTLTLAIRPVPDFVARVAAAKSHGQQVIAFAAESGTDEEIQHRAEAKMRRKGVDAIVANPVRPGLGPESDCNELWILRPHRPLVHLGPADKQVLAPILLQQLFQV